MNLLQTLEAEQMKAVRAKAHPEFRAGDTLKVNVKVVEVTYDEKAKAEKRRERLQAFEGVCIARQGAGLNESFTVRRFPTAKVWSACSPSTARWWIPCRSSARAGCAAPSSIICAAGRVSPPASPSVRKAKPSRLNLVVMAGLDPATHPASVREPM